MPLGAGALDVIVLLLLVEEEERVDDEDEWLEVGAEVGAEVDE